MLVLALRNLLYRKGASFMGDPSFVDRYRWWLFLGAFAINVPLSLY